MSCVNEDDGGSDEEEEEVGIRFMLWGSNNVITEDLECGLIRPDARVGAGEGRPTDSDLVDKFPSGLYKFGSRCLRDTCVPRSQ